MSFDSTFEAQTANHFAQRVLGIKIYAQGQRMLIFLCNLTGQYGSEFHCKAVQLLLK